MNNKNDDTVKIIKLNNNKLNNNLSKPIKKNKQSDKKLNSIKKSDDPNNIANVPNDKKLNLKISETEYERPLITHTEKLSKEQIQTLLEDYEQVKSINDLLKISIGTHLRYFDTRDGNMKFRTGGVLTVNTGLPDYIILSSGHVSWSVQVKTSIFFRRITLKQYKAEVEKSLLEKEATIKGLHLTLKEKDDIIKELKEKLRRK